EEVSQHLRDRLLVRSETEEPGIARYSGIGPLGGFVRIAAVNTTRYFLRSEKHHLPLELAGGHMLAARTPDPEAYYLKQLYGQEFRLALENTIAAITQDERTILRLFFLDGLAIQTIAQMYGVHKSTVSRRITKSRKMILNQTERLIKEKLQLSESEFKSLLGLVRSRIDLTL